MDLILVLTDGCNRACRYCYANARRPGPMAVRIGERAIDCAWRTQPRSLRIGYFGGEPLLRFELLRRLTDYACARTDGTLAPTFHLSTNGDAVDSDVAAYLGDHGFNVGLSAHDEDLDATRRSLGLLRAAGINVRVAIVADPPVPPV